MNDLLQSMFEHGHLSADDVIAARTKCAEQFSSPVRCLRELNLAAPDKIQFCLNQYLHFQVASGTEIDALDERLGDIIPEDIATHLRVFCMGGVKNRLVVAMEDPTDIATRRKLEFFLEKKIVPVAATDEQITAALHKLYKVERVEKNEESTAQSNQYTTTEPGPASAKKEKQQQDDDFDLVTQKIATSNENQAAAEVTLENASVANVLQNADDDLFGGFEDDTTPAAKPEATEEIPIAAAAADDDLFGGFNETEATIEAAGDVTLDEDPVVADDNSFSLDSSESLSDETLPIADDFSAEDLNIDIDNLDTAPDTTSSLPLINLELASRVAVAFVKIGFLKTRESAIDALNEKLGDLSMTITSLSDKKFNVEANGQSFEIDLEQDEHPTEVEALTPILSSIARMAKSS